jgi:D-arabinose 1-dehydrogenase-like Zn-dependent alcohol dehydrogenase
LAKTGPLLCGGVTVFAPLHVYQVPASARVGAPIRQ